MSPLRILLNSALKEDVFFCRCRAFEEDEPVLIEPPLVAAQVRLLRFSVISMMHVSDTYFTKKPNLKRS